MAPIWTFSRCKTHTALEQKYNTAIAARDLIDTAKMSSDVDDSLQSRPDSGTAETPGRKSWKRRSKRRHIKKEAKDVNQYFTSSKLAKDMYDSR